MLTLCGDRDEFTEFDLKRVFCLSPTVEGEIEISIGDLRMLMIGRYPKCGSFVLIGNQHWPHTTYTGEHATVIPFDLTNMQGTVTVLPFKEHILTERFPNIDVAAVVRLKIACTGCSLQSHAW